MEDDEGKTPAEKLPGLDITYWIDLARLDRVLTHPPRFAILDLLLFNDGRADFQNIKACTELTQGNLSTQLLKLEAAGLVEIERIVAKKMRTTVVLTDKGRLAMREFAFALEDVLVSWKELGKG